MILVVVGTRPELVKMAPVVREAKALGLPVHVHCTMQSPDLVDQAILPWDSAGELWMKGRPAFVVVQGDTRTAFTRAVEAFEHGIPVFHVEAGVRTYDLTSPWPEEGYRQMISRIARWHTCTTPHNLGNLLTDPNHGLHYGPTVRVTGSPVVESVRERAVGCLDPEPTILLTLHRRENRGHFKDILEGIRDGAVEHGLSSVWPTHPNSWAEQECPLAAGIPVPCDPLTPEHFATTLGRSACVVTDSGGVQEEANALGVPCVVARTVTDRPESLGKGGAILGGVACTTVAQAIREALTIDRSTIDTTIFGDGTASKQIAAWWAEILNASGA